MTLRYALEHSLNVPTASVGNEVGIKKVAEAARDLGITSKLDEVPSLALGTSEVSLLEITAAYAALAAGGHARAPTPPARDRRVRTASRSRSSRSTIRRASSRSPRPTSSRVSCEGVIDDGTGTWARSLGVRGTVAGKTGTTDDYRDAWFVGYHAAAGDRRLGRLRSARDCRSLGDPAPRFRSGPAS